MYIRRTHLHVCVCPALFLRLQFELKKAVDTRTIGCTAAASSSPPPSPSPDPLGYFSPPPLPSHLPSKTSYSFFYSFSLSRSLPPFFLGSMTTGMKIRTEMHLARSSSRFASHGLTQAHPFALGHSLFFVQTLRSDATSSLNTLTLSIIMSPTKQSLSLPRVPSSSRSRS